MDFFQHSSQRHFWKTLTPASPFVKTVKAIKRQATRLIHHQNIVGHTISVISLPKGLQVSSLVQQKRQSSLGQVQLFCRYPYDTGPSLQWNSPNTKLHNKVNVIYIFYFCHLNCPNTGLLEWERIYTLRWKALQI